MNLKECDKENDSNTNNCDSCEKCAQLTEQLDEANAKCESLENAVQQSKEIITKLESDIKNEKFKFQKISKLMANQAIKNELSPSTATNGPNVIIFVQCLHLCVYRLFVFSVYLYTILKSFLVLIQAALSDVALRIFTESERLTLMGLRKEKKFDSTFVKDCVRFLYKDDLHALKYMTVKHAVEGKSLMSLERKEIIATALRHRLSRFKNDFSAHELHERSTDKKIDEHIQNAIQNTIKNLNKNEVNGKNGNSSVTPANQTMNSPDAQSSQLVVTCYINEQGYVVEEENDLIIEE